MKNHRPCLKFKEIVEIKKNEHLFGLNVGVSEFVLPLSKFPILLEIQKGLALTREIVEENKALLNRLIYNRLIEIELYFENVEIRVSPKSIQYLNSIFKSSTEKAPKAIIYTDDVLTYESPVGDATLYFNTTCFSFIDRFKDVFPSYLPNILSGTGEDFKYLEAADLAFLGASSLFSSGEKIGGLFLDRKLPIRKNNPNHLGEKLSYDGHEVDSSVLELYKKRFSCRNYSNTPLDKDKLFGLLDRLSFRRKTNRGDRKLYPNGGAIYENSIYYLSLNSESIEDNVYFVNEADKSLESLDISNEKIEMIKKRFVPHSWDNHAHGYLIITSSLADRMEKYRGMALRHGLVNVGVIVDFIYLNCVDLGLASCAHGSWSGSGVLSDILELDFFSNPILGVVGVGIAAQENEQ